MMTSRRSGELLRINLREQIDFISASCARYDEGHEAEAKRIALSLRILVHDTNRSDSILALMGIKESLEFVDTSDSLMVTPSFEMPLGIVVPVMDRGNEHYEPILGASNSHRRVQCDNGWNRVLIRPVDHEARAARGEQGSFARRDFALGMANQEGGGHVQASPSLWWRNLRDQDYLGAMRLPDGRPIANLVPATIRQMGWEIIETCRLVTD